MSEINQAHKVVCRRLHRKLCRLFRSTDAQVDHKHISRQIVVYLLEQHGRPESFPSAWKRLYVSMKSSVNARGMKFSLNRLATNHLSVEDFVKRALVGDYNDPRIMKRRDKIETDCLRTILLVLAENAVVNWDIKQAESFRGGQRKLECGVSWHRSPPRRLRSTES